MYVSQEQAYLTASQPQRLRRQRPRPARSPRHSYDPYRCNPYHEFARGFNANDTLDPFYTHITPNYPPLGDTRSDGRPLPVLHSAFDAYAASQHPSYVHMSQERLRADMFATGANADTLELYMAAHNKLFQDMLELCGGKLANCGVSSVYLMFICIVADWSLQ